MEGEDMRSGTKKKKRSKPSEIGFDSDNDEPIGSMFKVKRNKKKVSLASEGSIGDDAIRGKGDFRVMDDDDTLASFRKRLKGPKRDNNGSETTTALKVNLEVHDDGLVAGGSGSVSKDEREVALLLSDGMHLQNSCDDQHMEDSLSTIFYKAQSNSVRKPSKQRRRNWNVDGGLSPGSKTNTDTVDLDSVVESRSGSAPVSKSVGRNHESAIVCSVSEMDNQKRGDVRNHESATVCSVSEMDNENRGDDCLQEENAVGICDSNIPVGPSVDHSQSIDVCHGDGLQLSCVQVEDVCGASDENAALHERILNDGSNQCSAILQDVEIIDTVFPSKMGEGACRFSGAGDVEIIDTASPSKVREGVCGFSETGN